MTHELKMLRKLLFTTGLRASDLSANDETSIILEHEVTNRLADSDVSRAFDELANCIIHALPTPAGVVVRFTDIGRREYA